MLPNITYFVFNKTQSVTVGFVAHYHTILFNVFHIPCINEMYEIFIKSTKKFMLILWT